MTTTRAATSSHLGQRSREFILRVKELADATDRAFLSVAGGIGKLGTWLRAAPARDQPRIAAVGARAPVFQRPSRCSSTRETCTGNCRHCGAAAWTSPLCSFSSPPACDCAEPLTSDAGAPPAPAGVTPVLQALGRVVEEHGKDRYVALAQDERFWELFGLLRTLTEQGVRFEVAPAYPASCGGSASAESELDIHVEEDLSQLDPRTAPPQTSSKRRARRERKPHAKTR